jgi:hypothetical protein
MADQLATPEDLASFLQQDLDLSTATLLVEVATAVVQQAAGGQRIVQVVGDVCSILSTSDSWLDLPQIPVTAVTSVVLDGLTLTVDTDYKRFGNRLWNRYGWQNKLGWVYGWDWRPSYAPFGTPWTGQEPSLSAVTYTHGYASGSQELQLGRGAVLALGRAYMNPSGVTHEKIDDYMVAFDAMSAAMESTPHLKAALRRAYGRRGGLVRIG